MGKKLNNVKEKRSRKSEILEKNKIDIRGMKEPTNQIKKQWEAPSTDNTRQKKYCQGWRMWLRNNHRQQ